jgi:hypothetical protein
MKTRHLLLPVALSSLCGAYEAPAQVPSQEAVHKVSASSQKNQIVLTVANESRSQGAFALDVRAVKVPAGIILPNKAQTVKTLAAAQETECTFHFDVLRSVKIGAKDTLEFLVQDRQGGRWMKQVVVEYTGPANYKLEQNFPNPFNPSTTIYYDLPIDSRISIILYDILGRKVTRLVDRVEEAGYHDVRFDAHNLASGAYIYRMQADPIAGGRGFSDVKKLIVLK